MLPSLPPLATLKEAARAAWPERRLTRFRVHGEGWSSLVLEADDRLIFRFPRSREVADSSGFESRALEILSRHLSAPIPVPVRVSTLVRPRGWSFTAYRKLPGVPLSKVGALNPTGERRLGEFIGTLLRELAAMPCGPLLRIGAKPGSRRVWEKEYRELQKRFERVDEYRASPALRRTLARAFDCFYSDLRASRYRPVVTHRDLGPDHVLWDTRENRPSGVIDWGDVRLGDPALDLTGLAGMGPARIVEWARARQSGADSTFDERLRFYRRVWPIHGVIYAAQTRNARLLGASMSQLAENLRA